VPEPRDDAFASGEKQKHWPLRRRGSKEPKRVPKYEHNTT